MNAKQIARMVAAGVLYAALAWIVADKLSRQIGDSIYFYQTGKLP